MGLWQCHFCQMLFVLGKVKETLACPKHQTPLTRDTWQVFRCPRSLGYAPWYRNGDQVNPNGFGSVAMTVPWSDGSVAWNNLSFTTTEIWYRGHYTSPSLFMTHMAWSCITGHVLYLMYHKKFIGLMSICVAQLTLTYLTETHGELVFDIAWCCQPHRMGHGQYPNLKLIWMDGWSKVLVFWTKLKVG